MTAIKNNGTAVAVATKKVNAVTTAAVENNSGNDTKKAINLPANLIEPSNYNARKTFAPDAMNELMQSISVHGLIQPITVRKKSENREHYEIICGERRFRACCMLNMKEIPCMVCQATDEQAYDLSIIENLQREDVPPMEAAEAYKRLIDTKRYDIVSLAVTYGKSKKHIYQMLKLCDLIKGIANLVKTGKLTASAGIVISKYDKKTQEAVLKDRFDEHGAGEWHHISATNLDSRIKSYYTSNLNDYDFDKTECLKCNFNSKNFDLFTENTCGTCGKCTNKECLEAKNTLYIVGKAQEIALADPKLIFIGDQYGRENDATKKIKEAGYEFKNVHIYNLNKYPTKPAAPEAAKYEKPEDLEKAQKRYEREQTYFDNKTQELDSLKAQGKIRVYADIDNKGITLYYKEVNNKDVKTNEQIITDLKAKKIRNSEIAKEKTAGDIKELLRTDELPKSDFTPVEEQAMYFFMLDKLRRSHYSTINLKENDYYGLTDEKKLIIVANLTEEQKTVIRRDYLYSHLTERTNTISDVKGGMMLAFAMQHLPEKTATIETQYKEEYDTKNARLDERIAGLKKAEKKAKAENKAKKTEQTKATNASETVEKIAKKGTNATAPKSEIAKLKEKEQFQTTRTEKKETKSTPQADKALIVGAPTTQPKPEAVAV
ncbi:ParB/RepB/Spo0J family partition protein [Bacteroides sp. 519]|uniref:ParB/RepB/Spo0J family partition protein n=1 Tax=Bacteroides sp. 519 TaxID=2302937 RepID=UPI0013D6F3A3|nr:ParB/RepB/Spo0J family partition protein [Bacteroides sp. 519]NDV60401.1 ParB/RepB/Spo0J family partition protein [Bacteroides sp. 519]